MRRVTTFGKLYIKPGLVCDGLWSLPDRAEGSLYAQGCGPGRAEDTLYVHGARLDRAEGPLDALGSKPFVSNFGFNKTLNLYIYWVHKTGITYPTLQMTKTCLKRRLFYVKNDVFEIVFGFSCGGLGVGPKFRSGAAR